MQSGHNIRRRVLEKLYRVFREKPYEPKSVAELITELGIAELADAEWNLSYLERKGLIKVDFISVGAGGVGKFASITTEGIDLVENPLELERLFPEAGSQEAALRLLERLRQEIVSSELPEGEKSAIFEALEKLSAHPDAAEVLTRALLKTFFDSP